MKLLILGGTGMAGHIITSYLKQNPEYEVHYTSRVLNDGNSKYLDVTDFKSVESIIESIKPDIIINCVGILNHHAENNPLLALMVNSLLPHQLARLSERHGGKLIQISTDCVFSGMDGNYTEYDIPDGTSVYAQTKHMGEIVSGKHLTIRTSIIGPELKEEGIGLFLWFMKQVNEIKGYEKVLWNGVTTLELARSIETMIRNNVTGLYHLGKETKISKYELLKLIQDIFEKRDVKIIPDRTIELDRTIKSTRTDFIYVIPSYEEMLQALKDWMISKSHKKNIR
ncbi:dTDP-4-dehydrorhamnose reductase family protein [Fictibacillus terranigra]|uniref:dTDP-4-dehydrorhamnose reductase n=1 Tax=Fictibacillus terranigra TaxID=3058424 RepID=A0ABT8E6Z1_9BACL|nr:SDR family oxidoreductase [Fictibacillus sp. CENA-BCM004]MDN4073665.1 SDR family oxidoreductase [Fictibacillus sp. CENA-BCM004]